MKKHFWGVRRDTTPVVFLGDLMDGGREIKEDDVFEREMTRFRRIFGMERRRGVSGNHDIGVGDHIIPKAKRRFERVFGESEWIDCEILEEFCIVAVDSVVLVGMGEGARGVREFVKGVVRRIPQGKRVVLLSHIPLYRDEDVKCEGGRTQSVSIRDGSGYQYQSRYLFKREGEIKG